MGDALEFLVEGLIIQLHKFNGNPIGLQLPEQVELKVTYTEPAARAATPAATSPSWPGSRPAWRSRCRSYIKSGEKVKVYTETGEFAGRA